MREDYYDSEDYEDFEDTQEGKYLTFGLDKEVYGIAIRQVMEIIGIQKVTPLPEMPEYVKGVINLRGKVIPVIDVRLKFGLSLLDYHDRTCIIVVAMEEMEVGLIVDRVDEVLDIPAENVDLPPKINRSARSRYISGMGKIGEDVVIILDVSKLLQDSELVQLQDAAMSA